MLGCPECGKFRMASVVIDRSAVVSGERYEGRMPVYRCRSCATVYFEPELENDFHRMMQSVASGETPERENLFEIRRASTPRTFGDWLSGLFGLGGARPAPATKDERSGARPARRGSLPPT